MRYSRGLGDESLKLWLEQRVPQRLLLPILDCRPGDLRY
jgi:hypothetical protein